MRIMKLASIWIILAALLGCASVSDGPLPTFENIAGYPRVLPDSSNMILNSAVNNSVAERNKNIATWNELAERFDEYLITTPENHVLDEHIEALVARFEYKWREMPVGQKRELLTLHHMASRMPGYRWPYTAVGWQDLAAEGAEKEWPEAEQDMRLRAMPSTWLPSRNTVSQEEVQQWMAYYSLHRLDVRTFWVSLNLMLERVRMQAPELALLPEREAFDLLSRGTEVFAGYPAFDHFVRSQLLALPSHEPRETKTTTLWQDMNLKWLPLLFMRLKIDRWDMQQFLDEQNKQDMLHRLKVSYFGMVQLGCGRLSHDVYEADASGQFVKTSRAGEGVAFMPFWLTGSGELFINGKNQEMSAVCSPLLFGSFKVGTQRMKYAGPLSLLYHGGYDTRPETPYVHSLGFGALWLSTGDSKHRNTRHGPLWGIIGAGRTNNRPAIYLLWQGIPVGAEKTEE